MFGTILAVHKDIGLLFALAVTLENHQIGVIPAGSVKQAHTLLKQLTPELDLLIVQCCVRGVCRFAAEAMQRRPSLRIIGLLSESHACGSCQEIFSASMQDHQSYEVQKLAGLVRHLIRQARSVESAPGRQLRPMVRWQT
jgi:DNA-binding NtrC family response regulator